MRLVRYQAVALKLCASTATTVEVVELLKRIRVKSSKFEEIPCCIQEQDLPALVSNQIDYTWEAGEASSIEINKGRQ